MRKAPVWRTETPLPSRLWAWQGQDGRKPPQGALTSCWPGCQLQRDPPSYAFCVKPIHLFLRRPLTETAFLRLAATPARAGGVAAYLRRPPNHRNRPFQPIHPVSCPKFRFQPTIPRLQSFPTLPVSLCRFLTVPPCRSRLCRGLRQSALAPILTRCRCLRRGFRLPALATIAPRCRRLGRGLRQSALAPDQNKMFHAQFHVHLSHNFQRQSTLRLAWLLSQLFDIIQG